MAENLSPEQSARVREIQCTTAELVAALAAYEFRDLHGHPLRNCAEFVELQRRAGDGCDAWFKVERLGTRDRLHAVTEQAVVMQRAVAASEQDVARAILQAAGFSVPQYRAARAAADSLAQAPRRPGDPAEPEPAVQEPRPKPPAPAGQMAIESARHVHDAAMRAAEIATRNGMQTAADFAKAYIEAANAIQDAW